MATTQNCIKVDLMLIRKVATKILVFGKLFTKVGVSMAIKSYNQLKIMNLVTMATTNNCIKAKKTLNYCDS